MSLKKKNNEQESLMKYMKPQTITEKNVFTFKKLTYTDNKDVLKENCFDMVTFLRTEEKIIAKNKKKKSSFFCFF